VVRAPSLIFTAVGHLSRTQRSALPFPRHPPPSFKSLLSDVHSASHSLRSRRAGFYNCLVLDCLGGTRSTSTLDFLHGYHPSTSLFDGSSFGRCKNPLTASTPCYPTFNPSPSEPERQIRSSLPFPHGNTSVIDFEAPAISYPRIRKQY
jgi:hypothetical protein